MGGPPRATRAGTRLPCATRFRSGRGVRALGRPREDRAPADLGGNPDVPDEPVATDVAVRRVGLCEPRADRQNAGDRRFPAAAQRAAAVAAAVRHGGGGAAADLGRADHAARLYRRLSHFLADRLFPLLHAVGDTLADLTPCVVLPISAGLFSG